STRGVANNSLTMTYFPTGCSTIIVAKSFHGPVRDGKGWHQLAMAIRHDLYGRLPHRRYSCWQTTPSGRHGKYVVTLGSVPIIGKRFKARHITGQGYRDKPHAQLVLVSLTHYCASTPSLSTPWSRTTLQGDQVPGKSHLKASFPLRCFQ